MVENITESIVNNADTLMRFGAKHFVIFGPASLALMPVLAGAGKPSLL